MFTVFTDQQSEVLQSSKAEQKSLLEKLQTSEQSRKVAEVSMFLISFCETGLCCALSVLTETLSLFQRKTVMLLPQL